METVTRERRDDLIAGFRREALHLEQRDVYAAADHGRFRKWLTGEPPDPAAEAEWWRPWREMMRRHREAGPRPGPPPGVAVPPTAPPPLSSQEEGKLGRPGREMIRPPP